MYGTVARMRLKQGAWDKMKVLMAEYETLKIPGMKGEVVYQSERDPNEYWMAVLFESKEAYQANANSPEQHKRYQRYRELLEADPEWHDGAVAYASM